MVVLSTSDLTLPYLQPRTRLTGRAFRQRVNKLHRYLDDDFQLTIGSGSIGILVSGDVDLPVFADAADYPLLRLFQWRIGNSSTRVVEKWYAYSSGHRSDGRYTCKLYLHDLLVQPPTGLSVDHLDTDTLDNRRANLSPATAQQQSDNRGSLGGRSRFKGVSWTRNHGGGWLASITRSGRTYRIGMYASEEAAASAYDWAARLLKGASVRLNRPAIEGSPLPAIKIFNGYRVIALGAAGRARPIAAAKSSGESDSVAA